jgi:hypothetical protein
MLRSWFSQVCSPLRASNLPPEEVSYAVGDCRAMISFRSILLAAIVLAAAGVEAYASKRVALVIGNSNYQHVARLANPANDAYAFTATLKSAGFEDVETRNDLKKMRRVLRDFANRSRGADVSVVYYASHGIEVDGTNYLISVDATVEQDVTSTMKLSRWTASLRGWSADVRC